MHSTPLYLGGPSHLSEVAILGDLLTPRCGSRWWLGGYLLHFFWMDVLVRSWMMVQFEIQQEMQELKTSLVFFFFFVGGGGGEGKAVELPMFFWFVWKRCRRFG